MFLLVSVMFMRDDDFSDKLHRNANFSGFTPLHYAVLGDSLECIRLLVNAGEFVKGFDQCPTNNLSMECKSF